MVRVAFLQDEKELAEKFLCENPLSEYEFITFNDIALRQEYDILYVFNKSILSNIDGSVNNIEHNLFETEFIEYIIVNSPEILKLITEKYDKILDVKIDEDKDTYHTYRFFRIEDKKMFKIILGFRNYYYVEDPNGKWKTIDGINVRKVHHYGTNNFDTAKHYEKDINKFKRYAMHKTKKIRLGRDFRICYFDIETNACVDTVNTQGEIISIVAQDSLTKKFKKWAIYPDKGNLIEQEKKMITDFLDYLRDFDVITGWNVMKFDIPYILNRATKLGINTARITLTNSYVSCKHKPGDTIYPWFVKVVGLHLVDMMAASVRALAYLDEKLKDSKLDTVAEAVLGENKIHTDTPAVLFRENRIDELMDYNVQDVALLMKIDEKVGITDLLISTLEFVPGLNLEDSNYNSKIIDFYLLSKFNNIVFPTVDRNKVTNVEGATVYDPISGIHDIVAVMDISGMYPNLIRTFNISPDTLIYEPEEDMIKIRDVMFTTKKEGILVKLIKDFQELRERYKKLKKEHENDPDYELYKLREFATKKILSSVYGVFGFTGFRLFNNDISNSITASGRALLEHMKQFAEKNGHIVIAGDTDSIFVKLGDDYSDDTVFEDLNIRMNDSLREYVAAFTTSQKYINEHAMNIEYETLFKRIIVPPAKKKYIGIVSKVKGKLLDRPKLYFKGSELNKKDVPSGFKQVIRILVDDILHKEMTKEQIINHIKSEISRVRQEVVNTDMKDLLIYKEINRDFDAYKVKPQHVRAAEASNQYLGTTFSRQDYKGGLLHVKSRKYVDVKTLFMSENTKLTNDFEIDYDKYVQKFLIDKINLIFGPEIFKQVTCRDRLISEFF